MNKGKQQKMINRKGGAQSVSELQQRLKAKLESLQGPKSDKPGKSDRKKLSKQEKKAKMMEEKKLASKMAKIRQNAAASSATAPATTNGVSKAKPVFNAEGKVVYSKFDLGTKSTINGQGTAANTSNPKKDPKAALASKEMMIASYFLCVLSSHAILVNIASLSRHLSFLPPPCSEQNESFSL